ncbi:hypothetical protein [Aliterella atlantica]|uniref:Uncharacterized protein n=1 Tax=Aliterella atlantica CENA595 TaxID=1618023 RepID=A0A0D8ZNF8_9CYAN|nr:hypothetical protein [Aliterella atlantica]KJH70280.1 hypothetical protein UH38_19240 [Aliterella atlantica CENA595]
MFIDKAAARVGIIGLLYCCTIALLLGRAESKVIICICGKVSKKLMRRKTNIYNINVVFKGNQFTFATDSEAQDFYEECQDKLTASDIEKNKVTLLMPAKITKAGKINSPA